MTQIKFYKLPKMCQKYFINNYTIAQSKRINSRYNCYIIIIFACQNQLKQQEYSNEKTNHLTNV